MPRRSSCSPRHPSPTPSATRATSGARSRASSKTPGSSSTTTPPSASSGASRSVARIGSSPGSDEGAERACVLYSLVASCKLHDVNPWDVPARCARAHRRSPRPRRPRPQPQRLDAGSQGPRRCEGLRRDGLNANDSRTTVCLAPADWKGGVHRTLTPFVHGPRGGHPRPVRRAGCTPNRFLRDAQARQARAPGRAEDGPRQEGNPVEGAEAEYHLLRSVRFATGARGR